MDWVAVALPLSRGLALAALVGAFGAALFRVLVAPAALARVPAAAADDCRARLLALLRSCLAAALILTALWIPVEAASMAGRDSLAGMFAATPVVLFDTHFGAAVMWRLGTLVVALWLARGGGVIRAAGVAAAAGLALALQSEMGHAAAADDLALPVAEILHLLAAGAWLGSLLPLLLLLRRLPGEPAQIAARRFSLLGICCVVVLVCSALVQAGELIGGMTGLLGTDYGRTALAKLALFVLLVGLGGINRFELTPHLSGPAAGASAAKLGVSIMCEMAAGLVVVFLAADLATEAPAVHQAPLWPFALRPAWRLLPAAAGAAQEAALAVTALAIMTAIGAAWQRFHWRGALVAALLICALAATQIEFIPLPNVVRGTGTVVAIEPESSLLVVNGDEIPDFMAAMTMPYDVANPSLLDGLTPGERVEFEIDRATARITSIRPTPAR